MITGVADIPPRRALPDSAAQDPQHAPQRASSSRLQTWQGRYELVSDVASPARIGLVLAALVLVVTGAFGGLDAVQTSTDAVPLGEPNKPLVVAPLTVKVLSVRHADALPPVAPAEPGRSFYLAVLEVTNTADSVVVGTTVAESLSLSVPGVDLTTPATLYRIDDSLRARGLQPDVPTNLVAVYAAPSTDTPPTEATLTLSSLAWHTSFASLSESGWRVEEPAFAVTLPIQEVTKG